MKLKDLIIGQEALCPHGLGRITEVGLTFPDRFVRISTYVNDCGCKWEPSNVRVIPIRTKLVSVT
jgi:hypothetical protein